MSCHCESAGWGLKSMDLYKIQGPKFLSENGGDEEQIPLVLKHFSPNILQDWWNCSSKAVNFKRHRDNRRLSWYHHFHVIARWRFSWEFLFFKDNFFQQCAIFPHDAQFYKFQLKNWIRFIIWKVVEMKKCQILFEFSVIGSSVGICLSIFQQISISDEYKADFCQWSVEAKTKILGDRKQWLIIYCNMMKFSGDVLSIFWH